MTVRKKRIWGAALALFQRGRDDHSSTLSINIGSNAFLHAPRHELRGAACTSPKGGVSVRLEVVGHLAVEPHGNPAVIKRRDVTFEEIPEQSYYERELISSSVLVSVLK